MRTLAGLVALGLSFTTLGRLRPSFTPARFYCARGPLSVATEWAEDPLIIVGKVAAVNEVADREGFLDRTIYQVQVARTYRGGAVSAVVVYSENDSGRFPMQRGESYILFLSRWEDGQYHVDNCGNSRNLADARNVIRQVRVLARRAGHR